jgi:carbon storage regulator
MLVLGRKIGESVMLGRHVKVTVVSVKGGTVRLAVSAPRRLPVLRTELSG